MKPRRHQRGFTLVELLVGAAITSLAAAVLLQLAVRAQASLAEQAAVTDLQQRTRVAISRIRRDLMAAGAGPLVPGAVPHVPFPAVSPARTGARNPDDEFTFAADRISMLTVPDVPSQTVLDADVAGGLAPMMLALHPACPDDACGFRAGDRLLLLDREGGGYETTAVAAAGAGQITPSSVVGAFRAGSVVAAVVQRTYYLDRPGKRLMVYDGGASDNPVVDGVTDLRFEYFGREHDPPWAPIDVVQAWLETTPVRGMSPRRFRSGLLAIDRVRVVLVLESREGPREYQRQVSFDVRLRNRAPGGGR